MENKIILKEDGSVVTFEVVGSLSLFYTGDKKIYDLPDKFEKVFTDFISGYSRKEPLKVVVDLKNCQFMNSGGLVVLVKAHKRVVDELKGQFVIINVEGSVRTLFELTRLFKFFKICSPEQLVEALV